MGPMLSILAHTPSFEATKQLDMRLGILLKTVHSTVDEHVHAR